MSEKAHRIRQAVLGDNQHFYIRQYRFVWNSNSAERLGQVRLGGDEAPPALGGKRGQVQNIHRRSRLWTIWLSVGPRKEDQIPQGHVSQTENLSSVWNIPWLEGLNWVLEASSFSVRCFVLRCLALTREHWASFKSASSLLLLLALALIHMRGHCLSSRSPVLLSLSFTCSFFFPIESALCRRPFLVAQTRPYLRLLAQTTNNGGESRNTAGLPKFSRKQ